MHALMLTVWAWMLANPVLVVPLVGAVASLVYTKLDAYPRVHAFFSLLASMGLDLPKMLAMLQKIFTGKDPPAPGGTAGNSRSTPTVPPAARAPSVQRTRFDAVASALFAIAVMGTVLSIIGLFATGCISAAPIIPVTPANTNQVSSCQSIASTHNDMVIGDFALGGITTGLASVSAAVSDSSTKNGLEIGAAIAGAVGIVGTAIAGYTSSEFANGNCSAVVGPLPVAASK